MVRDYKEEDFDSIWKINVDSFPKTEPEWFLSEAMNSGKTWVFELDGNIVGFIVGKVKNKTSYIHNVAVDKEFRNIGIASALVSEFERYYGATQKSEVKKFWLQVNHKNPAQKLYFDLGYRVGFVDENYYGKGEHAICMYKSSKPFSNK